MRNWATKRGPLRRAAAVAIAAALAAAAVAAAANSSAASPSTTPAATAAGFTYHPPGGYITNFVKYTDGKPGTANPKLSPALVGWSSNNSGGTVISVGPEATAAAQVAVDWVNKYADGIDGHPLELDQCIILNAEEEGLACAEKFVDNAKISAIAYGALSVGASTIDATVAGKKPIIIGFSQNAPDDVAKNVFELYGASTFGLYPFGTFAKQVLHAKSCAVIYPNEAGNESNAGSVALGCKDAGLPTKLVPFDPDTTDLTGPLTAAGAQSAGAVFPLVTSLDNCLAVATAIKQLNIPASKVLWYTGCDLPSIKAQYPGGDYPAYYSGSTQTGDALVNDPTGVAYDSALSKFGAQEHGMDDWYSGMFGEILTIAQMMNKVGYAKLSPASMLAQAKSLKGPLVFGGPTLDCGEFKIAPASCADGDYFFRYVGKGKTIRESGWLNPPSALVKQLKSLPKGASFPTF